jgi:microcystin degradation protein MlrC
MTEGGFYAIYALARHIVLCDADGVTRTGRRLFTYRNRRRPLFPFERDVSLDRG